MHALSIEHILCLSSMTQSHVTHSSMCKIVWVRQDNPTRHPDSVQGIVELIETPLNT